MPREPLDRIQAGGERLRGIGDAVAIGIDQDDDRVAGRIGCGIPILRSLPDEEAAAGVERHRAGIAHQGLAGEELHLQL